MPTVLSTASDTGRRAVKILAIVFTSVLMASLHRTQSPRLAAEGRDAPVFSPQTPPGSRWRLPQSTANDTANHPVSPDRGPSCNDQIAPGTFPSTQRQIRGLGAALCWSRGSGELHELASPSVTHTNRESCKRPAWLSPRVMTLPEINGPSKAGSRRGCGTLLHRRRRWSGACRAGLGSASAQEWGPRHRAP